MNVYFNKDSYIPIRRLLDNRNEKDFDDIENYYLDEIRKKIDEKEIVKQELAKEGYSNHRRGIKNEP